MSQEQQTESIKDAMFEYEQHRRRQITLKLEAEKLAKMYEHRAKFLRDTPELMEVNIEKMAEEAERLKELTAALKTTRSEVQRLYNALDSLGFKPRD
jgi:hypothetical protein